MDWQVRTRLHQLGEELATENWGVLWRTSAANQPSELLKNEIADLMRNGEGVLKESEHVEVPALLWEGAHYADVEFPSLSKHKLDAVRKTVAPTIDGHHRYKACGEKVSTALVMAEKLLEKGYSEAEVSELLKQTIEAEFPTVGSWIKIEHVKPDGKTFHLGPALIEEINHDTGLIRYKRVFKRLGVYDGLKTVKEPDDYALTEAKMGEWQVRTQYFSKEGRIKGTYINLNTPLELYSNAVRYVDLEVDVCVWPDGTVKTLDFERLEEAMAKGIVTDRLVGIVREKVSQIMRNIAS